ncbi:MAG: alkaline phosphatase family protein [Pseudomonadota bacterium]|nr:alkaline phosphatase family protein [Pseudomonadota bacterium]
MKVLARVLTGTALATGLFSPVLQATSAIAGDDDKVQHVLLVSIDGFHAVDLEICVAKGTCPNLEKLTDHGFTYTNASTTKPSDSFPGLLAPITGGTSKSTGVFYDDSYDRTLFAPAGNPPAPCASGSGAEVMLAENTEFNLHSIDGGKSGSLTGLNAGVAIDPNNLPGQKVSGSCTSLWPHNFIRTNTIFGVLHKHGLRTAWSDKHPAYDIINGNKPKTQPVNGPGTNVDDFFAPEINSDLSQTNVNLIHTQLGVKFSTAPDPTSFPAGADFTKTIEGVEWYDGIKVRATLNQINGLDHTGTRPLGTPVLFGMNFQAVSVGQKLAGDGYLDPAATPSGGLANAIAFVDKSIGQMISALDSRGLRGKTLVIVSAKHGQSPIDLSKLVTHDNGVVIKGPIGANFGFDIGDDGVLIWLKDNTGTKTADAVAALNGFDGDTGIGEWLSGPLLPLSYQDPVHDSRTPDIIGIAKIGVIYTKGSKIAEHGGLNEDDTHVALIVSHPFLKERSINTAVATTQIAPTILKALGLEPQELEAVRLEGTQILPGLFVDKE